MRSPPRPGSRAPQTMNALDELIVRSVVAFGVSEGLAIVWVMGRRGFGIHDLVPFAAWCLLYGVVVACVGRLFSSTLSRAAGPRRWISGAALGLAVSVVWTVVVYWLLGPWVLAFSFPTAWIWAIGAIAALSL
jgi:hypothetical protein